MFGAFYFGQTYFGGSPIGAAAVTPVVTTGGGGAWFYVDDKHAFPRSQAGIEWERMLHRAVARGVAVRALGQTVGHARTRPNFGALTAASSARSTARQIVRGAAMTASMVTRHAADGRQVFRAGGATLRACDDAASAGRQVNHATAHVIKLVSLAQACASEDNLLLERQRRLEDLMVFGDGLTLERQRKLEDLLDGTTRTTAPTLTVASRADYSFVHQIADAFKPAMKRAALASFATAKRTINDSKLTLALRARNEQLVLTYVSDAITSFETTFGPVLEAMLGDVLAATGHATEHHLKHLRAAAPSIRGWSFDATDQNAVGWAQQHAAETVSGISEATRDEIRDLVESAFDEQFDVDKLANEIADVIGDDARAEVIARTETMRASNEGQLQAWQQATDAGLLTGNEQQEWIVTPDDKLCPICEPMDGVTVGLDEQFDVDGDVIDGPPAHPNCRCTIGLVLPSAAMRAAYNDDESRDDHGRWVNGPGGGTKNKDKVAKAKASYNPSNAAKQQEAVRQEAKVATAVGGSHLEDNEPIDVVVKDGSRKSGIEVKTIIAGKRDKITMHPDSKRRKEAWVRKNGAQGHTVVIDARGSKATYYHRAGFGSFRLKGMTRVKLSELHALVRGKK